MFNDTSKTRRLWNPCVLLLKHLEAILCGDNLKKGPIKPSHQWQILPAQQSLLITANSWRSFQRGLYQGQEHLDLNYPWHKVWPFCYHWGGQHLLRGHGPRGHWGYQGQHYKLSSPPHRHTLPPPPAIHILSSSYGWMLQYLKQWGRKGIWLVQDQEDRARVGGCHHICYLQG